MKQTVKQIGKNSHFKVFSQFFEIMMELFMFFNAELQKILEFLKSSSIFVALEAKKTVPRNSSGQSLTLQHFNIT